LDPNGVRVLLNVQPSFAVRVLLLSTIFLRSGQLADFGVQIESKDFGMKFLFLSFFKPHHKPFLASMTSIGTQKVLGRRKIGIL
jgi:hypothetical protein